ncbi:permease [Dactylosporangium sp. NPDC005572]|uniref:FtsX-like permease family protein n=1 Tax=Dactylosporangium sp. NPDC005572 TaxID=3156889 RepID=UPI00339EF1AA
MLRLLRRRARAQWPLLVALLGVVAIGATLLGTCALLVTRTGERALEVAAARAPRENVDVTAYTVTVQGKDARSVAADTESVVTGVLRPFDTTTRSRASSVLRALPGPAGTTVPAQSYLSGMSGLQDKASLVEGRWPVAAGDAVLLESTAQLLRLSPGSRVTLGTELVRPHKPDIALTVVGIVRPLPGTGWDRDPLAGAGSALGFLDGNYSQPVNAYGPFIVTLPSLLDSGATLDRLEVTGHPDLSHPNRRDLDTVASAVRGADRRLTGALGDRVQISRVASDLPVTLSAADEQQRVTTAVVLAVALLGAVLTATALALAGRLTAGVREGETALLSALGISPGQFAFVAAVEAGALALLAAAVAIPASSFLHAGLTRLAPLDGAGLAASPAVTPAQLIVVLGGALTLAVVLVVRPAPKGQAFVRSGTDLLLVAFAAVGWWQLYAQPTGSSGRADAVRVLAPALLLAAGAALALRVVVPALRGADRLASRARGLVLPLAATEAARRPQAVAAGLLVGLACAAGTFGIAFDATWQRSQVDQADLGVGTDLALTLTTPPDAGQGAAVSAATGGTVSPAVDRGIAVGQWLGTGGDPPRLVAVDTRRADALLRGRLDGSRTWADVGATLAPSAAVNGVGVPRSLTGTATGATPLVVTPRLLVEDGTGLRAPCVGTPIPLDGRPHELPVCGGLRLVAVSLKVDAPTFDYFDAGFSKIAVSLRLPSDGSAGGQQWTVTSAPPVPTQISGQNVSVTATELAMTASVQLGGPPDAARTLVATAFEDPGPVPVAVSARFADEIGAHVGDKLSITIGTTPIAITVADIVPVVPSAPGAAAVLADLDRLSRALAVAGDLAFPVDAWWVGGPAAGAAERVAGLHLGTVTTRDGETARLTEGPLRAGLPAALRLLVPAAALLLLAGVVLHVTCDLQIRALEVARLRGLGMSRRQIRAVLLGQHAGVLLPLLAAGAAVGALATRIVAPLLVRSDTGAAPTPAARPDWPWAAEGLLIAGLLVTAALAVILVVGVQVRRADAAHLRVAS